MNDLFESQSAAVAVPVECLGQSFPSDAARRAHYLAILREKHYDAS